MCVIEELGCPRPGVVSEKPVIKHSPGVDLGQHPREGERKESGYVGREGG